MTDYRRLYESVYGPIPCDEYGRTFDIHHKDGNNQNNDISNLIALSIDDHYKIHYDQEDWAAAQAVLIRMNMSGEIISQIARKNSRKRVEEGTHNFLGGEVAKISAKKRVDAGTHHFIGGEISRKTTQKRIENGTHHFIGGDTQRKAQKKQLDSGTHHSQQKHTCNKCGKSGYGSGMKRWHFDNCRVGKVCQEL